MKDKGRCVRCVLYSSRFVSEFGRETWSIDVRCVLYKGRPLKCVRCEKASLEMVEMGLSDR